MIRGRSPCFEIVLIAAVGACGAVGCEGCHPRDDAPSRFEAGASSVSFDASPPSLPACTFEGNAVPIPDGALAVGDGVRDGVADAANSGAIFGVLRPNGAAAWAHVDARGTALTLHELPPSDPDAPPPRVVPHGDGRFLLYSRSGGGQAEPGQAERTRARLDASAASLRLVLAKIDVASGSSESTAEIASQRDDSLDNDAAFGTSADAGGLVVWDEDEPFARFGVIRAARLDTNGHLVGTPFTVTEAGTDAEAPRVFPVTGASGGFLVVYRARRSEDRDAGLVDNSVEAPGERRAYRWLEAVFVPANGTTATPAAASFVDGSASGVHRLTSQTGHVGTFDVFAAPDGVDVLVHDDDAPKDGAGARLSRIRIVTTHAAVGNPGDVGAAVPIVASGAGAGAVSWLDSVPSCASAGCDAIVYAGDDDGARMVRLASSASPASAMSPGPPSSREVAFDGTDPIVRLPNAAVLAFVRDKGGSLRTIRCP